MEVNLHAVFFIYLLTSSLRDIPRVLCLQLMEVSVALERSELSVNPVQVTWKVLLLQRICVWVLAQGFFGDWPWYKIEGKEFDLFRLGPGNDL